MFGHEPSIWLSLHIVWFLYVHFVTGVIFLKSWREADHPLVWLSYVGISLCRFQRVVKYVSPCYSPVALHVLMAYFAARGRGIGDLSLVPSGPLFRQCISYTKSLEVDSLHQC